MTSHKKQLSTRKVWETQNKNDYFFGDDQEDDCYLGEEEEEEEEDAMLFKSELDVAQQEEADSLVYQTSDWSEDKDVEDFYAEEDSLEVEEKASTPVTFIQQTLAFVDSNQVKLKQEQNEKELKNEIMDAVRAGCIVSIPKQNLDKDPETLLSEFKLHQYVTMLDRFFVKKETKEEVKEMNEEVKEEKEEVMKKMKTCRVKDCYNKPFFGKPSQTKARFCYEHKKEGMINLQLDRKTKERVDVYKKVTHSRNREQVPIFIVPKPSFLKPISIPVAEVKDAVDEEQTSQYTKLVMNPPMVQEEEKKEEKKENDFTRVEYKKKALILTDIQYTKIMFQDKKSTVQQEEKKYTYQCRSIIKNERCSHGKTCRFAHTLEQFNPNLCRFNDRCRNDNCAFKHANETLAAFCLRSKIFFPNNYHEEHKQPIAKTVTKIPLTKTPLIKAPVVLKTESMKIWSLFILEERKRCVLQKEQDMLKIKMAQQEEEKRMEEEKMMLQKLKEKRLAQYAEEKKMADELREKKMGEIKKQIKTDDWVEIKDEELQQQKRIKRMNAIAFEAYQITLYTLHLARQEKERETVFETYQNILTTLHLARQEKETITTYQKTLIALHLAREEKQEKQRQEDERQKEEKQREDAYCEYQKILEHYHYQRQYEKYEEKIRQDRENEEYQRELERQRHVNEHHMRQFEYQRRLHNQLQFRK